MFVSFFIIDFFFIIISYPFKIIFEFEFLYTVYLFSTLYIYSISTYGVLFFLIEWPKSRVSKITSLRQKLNKLQCYTQRYIFLKNPLSAAHAPIISRQKKIIRLLVILFYFLKLK